MSLVGDFWTHPNALYHDALLDLGFGAGRGTHRGVLDDLASIVILTVFSVIQCYLSLCIVRYLVDQRKLSPHSRKSPQFSIVAVVVFILFLVATVLTVVTFSTKVFAATRVTWYPREAEVPYGVLYSCVLPGVYEGCPLFFTYTPSPLASWLDTALGAVFQAVVIVADGLLLYRCFVIFRDKPWVYGAGVVVYLASIVIPFVFVGLLFTHDGPMTVNIFDTRQRGFGDNAVSFSDFRVGSLTLLHVLILSIASSMLVNLIVTGAIAFRVIRARRRWSKLKTDLVYVQSERMVGTGTVLTILLEAALPPAILGVIICGMSLSRLSNREPTYTHSLRVLWVSLTALAPQLIAVRVSQGKTWEQQQESAVSRPLQFAMSETVRSPLWLEIESPRPVRFRRLSERPQVEAKFHSEGRNSKV